MALIQVEMNQVNSGGTSDVIVPNAIANGTKGTKSATLTATNGIVLRDDSSQSIANVTLPSIDVRYLLYHGPISATASNPRQSITWTCNSSLVAEEDIVEIKYSNDDVNGGEIHVVRAMVGDSITHDYSFVQVDGGAAKTLATMVFKATISTSGITFHLGTGTSVVIPNTSGQQVYSGGLVSNNSTTLHSVHLIKQPY